MKVIVVVPRLSPSAPISVATNIVNGLCNHIGKENVKVLYLKESKNKIDLECETMRVNKLSLFNKELFRDADIVHSHCFSADLLVYMHSFFFLRRKFKWLSTVHQFNYHTLVSQSGNSFFSFCVSFLWERIWSRTNYLVTLSKAMTRYYEERVNSRITHVYNGHGFEDIEWSDCSRLEKLKGILNKAHQSSYVLGCVSRLIEVKRLDLVIKAVASTQHTVAVFLGSGDKEEDLKSLARTLNVEHRCLFVGHVDDPRPYFYLFDSFVMASDSEGFPLSLLEACSTKRDIICSDIEIAQEIFDTSEVTFFKKGDVSSLILAIKQRISDTTNKSDLAYQKYLDRFQPFHMVENYFILYKKVILEK